MPQIEVPGVGTVFADGFAEESTMQRILNVLQASDNANSPEAMQRLAGAAQSASVSTRRASQQLDGLGSDANAAGGAISGLSASADNYNRRMMGATRGAEQLVRTLGESPYSITKAVVENVSKAGGALFNMLGDKAGPLGKALGFAGETATMLGSFIAGQLIGELEKTNNAFINVQKNGALLGGSLLNLRIVSATAGLTMEQFSGVVSKAGGSLAMFGGTTTEGAREFARANQNFVLRYQDTMLRLGIGFEEMGIRTAEFMEAMVLAGQNMYEMGYNTDDVADATATLAMQQKQLAAFNGTTIEQEKERQRLARRDAQLNIAMSGLNAQQQESIRQLTGAFPELQQFIKETVAFGGPISKDALMQQSLMGSTTDAIQATLNQIQSGVDPEGAIGALARMRETSGAIADELANQREIGLLAIAGSTNNLVQMAAENFQVNLERSGKLSAGVFEQIQSDFTAVQSATDAATTAVVNMTKSMQMFSVAVSGAIVQLLGNDTFMKLVSLPTDVIADIAMAISPAATTADLTGASAAQTGEVVANRAQMRQGLMQELVDLLTSDAQTSAAEAADAGPVPEAGYGAGDITVGPGGAATINLSEVDRDLLRKNNDGMDKLNRGMDKLTVATG